MNDTTSTLVRMIHEVLGDDWDPERPITGETSFSDDLEMESIEFVALSEKLNAHYEGRVDFVGWFAKKELDEIIQLKVGQVVEYVDRCLSAEQAS